MYDFCKQNIKIKLHFFMMSREMTIIQISNLMFMVFILLL